VTRVFLLNPPAPEPVRTPLLAFCHLAASLRAAGHEVALLDACAPFAPKDHATIAAVIGAFAPDVVGLHVKTLHVQHAYATAAAFEGRWPLIAGGPHATVCPEEPLVHGFDWVVQGEGEHALVELADAIGAGESGEGIDGILTRPRLRKRGVGERRDFIDDLDALPPPLSAVDLFDPAWYGASAPVAPAGLLSSRGCPAACTFCSNNVTGRKFRYRSPEAVAAEVADMRTRFGTTAFTFLDDSFAVGRRRVRELAAALRQVGRGMYWTCTAHPAHLDPPTLAELKSAGCGGIDIGMESGDPQMLVRIGKGVEAPRVLEVLRWCREAGIHVVLNLMFGWPDETEAELEGTIDFMARAAPWADGFNARGILVPYPGTEIYDKHHERFGFTGWWLRDPPIVYAPFPTAWDVSEIKRAYADDPALERNFFRHPPRQLALMQQALARKAEHTIDILERKRTATPAQKRP
jgi:anaerobic magnesium-protoporphyrin IX monomethyl ester cyclase